VLTTGTEYSGKPELTGGGEYTGQRLLSLRQLIFAGDKTTIFSFMLSEKEVVRISRFLSLVLRHQPQTIGLQLDEQGWAPVDSLLQNIKAKGFYLDQATLQHIVDTNNKKRFAFNGDKTKIRASQGHSIAVDLGYSKTIPPPVLYHGTAEKNVAAILKEGLKKRSRQQVHLSAEKETAMQVGRRHGTPVVVEVASARMHADGYQFFLSANSVWLTDAVPAAYLRLIEY
jgi:putative RNA 2'-phosphotransferase